MTERLPGTDRAYELPWVERLPYPLQVPGVNIFKTNGQMVMGEFSYSADGQSGTPVNSDTIYDLASVSKLYTAALILRQAEKGAIDLDGRAGLYMEGRLFSRSSVTVRDMLSHRVDFGVRLADYRDDFADDFKNALLRVPIPSSQSEYVHYHNLGYIYLGYMLEQVTGQDLQVQMTKLFKDLGLDNTFTGASCDTEGVSYAPATEILHNGRVIQGVTHDESARLHGGLAGNAGVFASARDLAKFG